MAGNNLGVAQGSIKVDTSELKNADIALRSAGGSMINFGQMAVGAFAAIVGEAAKFEKEMDFVQAITNATAGEMEALENKAIDLAKNSVYGPIELSQAFVELVKAGASAQQIIEGVGEASVNLATAADVEIPFAGENLINIMNTFKLGAEDAIRVSDLLAGAANASSVGLEDIVTTMKYAGPVAQGLGIDIADVNDALSILGKVGIKGSTAGTSLRQIMLNLSPPTKAAKEAMEALGIITEDGSNQFFDAEGNAKSLAEVFGILGDATKDLNNQQKTEALRDLFGVRAIPAALELMSQGEEGFRAINEEINRTTAADVAAKRMDNLDGSIKRLKATLSAMFVEAGGPFQEMLKGWVDGARNILLWIDALPGPLKTFLVGAVGVIGVLSLLAGGFLLTIGNIVRMVRVMGEIKNAMGLMSGVMRGVTAANGAMSASFLLNPFFLLAAAIAAVIAGLVLLYFHFKPFREFIDNMWQDIQKFWDNVIGKAEEVKDRVVNYFDDAVSAVQHGGFSQLWDIFKDAPAEGITEGISGPFKSLTGDIARVGIAFDNAKNLIGGFIETVKNKVGDLVSAFWDFLKSIPGAVLGFFTSLPGVVIDAMSKVVGAVIDALKELPRQAGYWLGFMVGRFIRIMYYEIPKAIIQFGVDVVMLWQDVWALLLNTIIEWGPKVYNTVKNALVSMATAMLEFAVNAAIWAWETFSGMLSTAITFVQQLPGKVASFLWQTIANLIASIPEFTRTAGDIGRNIIIGIVDFIANMPDRVKDILMRVIKAFTDLVQTAFNAAKNFAGGLWDGFKDGLGINSPSFIEESMFAIEDQMKSSARTIAQQVRKIQGMSSGIPTLNAGAVGMTSPAVAANGGLNASTYNQNAPLIGQATIRSDQDVVLLGRQLERERQLQARARGIAPAMIGV